MLRGIPVQRDCSHCGRVEFSAAVSVIVVWAHGLKVAVPVIPQQELRLCATGRCGSAHRVVSRAFEDHPQREEAIAPWMRATIVFEDGNGVTIWNAAGREFASA